MLGSVPLALLAGVRSKFVQELEGVVAVAAAIRTAQHDDECEHHDLPPMTRIRRDRPLLAARSADNPITMMARAGANALKTLCGVALPTAFIARDQ